MNLLTSIQTGDDFAKARRAARLSQIRHFLNPGKDRLLSLSEVQEILRPKNQTYAGIQDVPVKLIVGSEGRYKDFTKRFLPKDDRLRERWQKVDEAFIDSIGLPLIQLYEIGGVYFVRDGNHRVSVAKTKGVEMISAEVTRLDSEIVTNPKMSLDELRQAVIKYEKRIFYTKTFFGDVTGFWDLDFTQTGLYDVIYKQILAHQRRISRGMTVEVPFEDALLSWYQTVYRPAIRVIITKDLCARFKNRTPSDLFVWFE
jgi:hypothetical protein